jgi:hypothetical protein
MNHWLSYVENVEIDGLEKYEPLHPEQINKIIELQNSHKTGFVVFHLLYHSPSINLYDIVYDEMVDDSYMGASSIDEYKRLKQISQDKEKKIEYFASCMNDYATYSDDLIRFSPDIILLTNTIGKLYTRKISIDDFIMGNWIIQKKYDDSDNTYTEKLMRFYVDDHIVLK